MAESNPPSFIQGAATETAAQARKMIEGLISVPGVVATGDLLVSANGTPNMSVNVAAGGAFVRGSDLAVTQGTYHLFSDSTVNKAIAASDATNPRIDRIVARVRDAFYIGGAVNAWDLFVVAGTPAATPVAPAVPASSLLLADVAVGAAVTTITNANITDRRIRATATGARPADQVFYDPGSVGQITTYAAYQSRNSLLVAPYDLTMIVESMVHYYASGATTASFQIQDEAGASITHGLPTNAVNDWSLAGDATARSTALRGQKVYTAGQTCGYRSAFKNSGAVFLYVGSTVRVSFVPR